MIRCSSQIRQILLFAILSSTVLVAAALVISPATSIQPTQVPIGGSIPSQRPSITPSGISPSKLPYTPCPSPAPHGPTPPPIIPTPQPTPIGFPGLWHRSPIEWRVSSTPLPSPYNPQYWQRPGLPQYGQSPAVK